MENKDRVIIALDVDNMADCRNRVDQLCEQVSVFKIGMELYTACGQDAVEYVHKKGSKVFLDLKFHDIPNTVASVSRVATQLGVFMFNVHACGGGEMMRWASEACVKEADRLGVEKPLLIGVTVLTSLSEEELQKELSVSRGMEEQVVALAQLAKESGLDGVVSSPKEIELIKNAVSKDFVVVTPGIRPEWFVNQGQNDQKRVLTPNRAFDLGADFIVIGRPVTQDASPRTAMQKVLEEIN